MALTKARTSMNAATSMVAAAADVTGASQDLTASYGAELSVKLTNGATGPTIAAQVQIQVANDAAGTLWSNFGGPLVGLITNNGISQWLIELPFAAGAVRLISGSNTGQNVTLDADISKVTAI